jgi:hypothetical protein
MTEAGSRGPQIAPNEVLYRAITVEDWWDLNADPPRVRSFAFKVDSPFSVNVASKMPLTEAIRHLHDVLKSQAGGIVSFNCGEARSHRFDARDEPDPDHPENTAHANVYYDGSNSQRKRDAKRLAEDCTTVHKPNF